MGNCEKNSCGMSDMRWCMMHCWARTCSILVLAICAVIFVLNHGENRNMPHGGRPAPMNAQPMPPHDAAAPMPKP